MDLKQTNHLKAYGIAYWALTRGIEVDWLLNYRSGSFMIDGLDIVSAECRVRGVTYEALAGHRGLRHLRRDPGRGQQHGRDPAREGPEDRRLCAPQFPPVGRRGDARARVRGDPLRQDLGRRGAARFAHPLRLAAPPPRGLHRPVREVLRQLRDPAMVYRAAGDVRTEGEGERFQEGLADEGGRGAEDQGIRRRGRVPVRDVLGNGHLRHRPRLRKRGHLRRDVRRRSRPTRSSRRSWTTRTASRSPVSRSRPTRSGTSTPTSISRRATWCSC